MKKLLFAILCTVFLGSIVVSCTKDSVETNEIDVYSPDKDKIDPPGGNG